MSELSTYKGYSPKHGDKVPVLQNLNDLTPKDFYDKFIATRTPVIIKSSLPESDWKGYLWQQQDYLLSKIGDIVCKVEPIDPVSGTFGQGMSRNEMSIKEFFQKLKNGERLYLTTQYDESNEVLDGDDEVSLLVKSLCPHPTDGLLTDFSITPALMGNLVPQQCNLWIGKSENGTSSGLHHDFHDNIYAVISGYKRFVIISPDHANQLKLSGKISKIHPNGLISYEGEDCPQRSDGLTELDAAIAKTQFLEKKIGSLKELAVPQESIELLEAEYENEMDRVLQMQIGGPEEDWNDLEEGDAASLLDGSVGGDPESDILLNEGNDIEATSLQDTKPELPDHFTKVSVNGLHKFMGFDDAKNVDVDKDELSALAGTVPLVVDLEPGDMLYLPASWFHEVTSSSASSGGSDVHIAFNYWFHPPDNLEDFDHPYLDRNIWQAKRHLVGEAIDQLYATNKKNEKRPAEDDSPSQKKTCQ
ncbi:histone demethylase Jmj4 [Schizosaccharomyces pombe]|uniref:JmjC domain-containing protein 4 n=1 Tax=Schizosaccharomyces pombe (strain 972 / ATCC 24843) TaxID=284812 RepID=JMJ4_SCHPO|nr:putative protein Jmj4 [Schizosaccharomyces pombe]O94606.1 RecName: Full=JmjC domain-containing protein 4; AltName: Full=Jumonji domain-containing protein 4; AltName: Full=Meiotically up-regulated gene 149 protein [Schizosaccharomyces pombe 972h-]CAA21875.2 Jmj4 protein (predicted) [Schizosaccharomyces pombe]|eukprot:NP_588191.1 putative protein Jmj4 [Schizosaccharomyces pombe]